MPHRVAAAIAAVFSLVILVQGHEHTLHKSTETTRAARARLSAQAEAPEEATGSISHLTINLMDAENGHILPGLVRATNLDSGKSILLIEGVQREGHWYAVTEGARVSVPPVRLRIEAFHGLETAKTTVELDLSGTRTEEVNIGLKRFYDSRGQRLRSGNTHLHLRDLSRVEAERYLRVVAQADDLDLLFVSYLRRIPGEETYISNSFTSPDLERLSDETVLLGNGEEHRHNFGAGGEGYGHVMFLNLPKMIEPVSIGPGIMGEGTDGIPLQRGIRAAHAQDASVIWCHNNFGLEDIPNWVAGLIDAQNIFDGGSPGDYNDTFYRYLNAGMRVPFSTGTDWFVYDFSRVYVPIQGELTVEKWLAGLVEGRSYITNGPLLEFEVAGRKTGDTVFMEEAGHLDVEGRVSGRNDFAGLELVWNGKVVHEVSSVAASGYFEADLRYAVPVGEPGWLALRIPLDAGPNDFEKPIFAHSSPVYIHFQGESIFLREVATGLIEEMQQNLTTIQEKALFADAIERKSVLDVYRQGIHVLQESLRANSR